MRVSVNDPRYKSGELKCIWSGRKHTESTLIKKRSVKYTEERRLKAIQNGKVPCSEEKRTKISASLTGRTIPEQTGRNNPTVKLIELINPQGVSFFTSTFDLASVCIHHKLQLSRILSYRDKGKIPSPGRYECKQEPYVNTTGWEVKCLGLLREHNYVKLFSIE